MVVELQRIAELTNEYLTRRGMTADVRLFSHPDMLLSVCETETFHIFLLDMVMPVMDGEECFRRLKSLDPSVRVVIASGFTRDADFASIRQEGLAGYIRKPYSLEQLSSLLDQIFHQQRDASRVAVDMGEERGD